MPFISGFQNDNENDGTLSDSIYSLWQKLALSTGQTDPVCCAPAWNLAYHSVFHPDCRIFYLQSLESLLVFYEARSPGDDIYLAPLEDSWFFGQPLLGFYAPELLKEALEIFARYYKNNFPVIYISGVRENNPEAVKLYMYNSGKFNFYRYPPVIQCSASLAGGLDGWLSRRSANHRAKLRKASRHARANGVYFERFRPKCAEEAVKIYNRMLAVELQSWKGLGHCGMAETPSREFYAELMQRYTSFNMANVIFAVQDGKDLGFVFGGATASVYRGQQFSYIDSAKKLSIGNLLQYEQIKWLCEQGVLRYDMGPISGARMAYKSHWTECREESRTWIMRLR